MIYMEYFKDNKVERYQYNNIINCISHLSNLGIIKHVIIKDTRITPKVKYIKIKGLW